MRDKIENFRIKYAIIFTILIYSCTLNKIFCFLAFVLGVYIVLKYKFEMVFPLFMFMMPMSSIFKTSAGGTSYFTYLELLLVVVYLLRNKMEIRKTELGIIFFCSYIIITQILNGAFSITITIKMVAYLFLISLANTTEIRKIYKACFMMFIMGLIISSLMGLINIPGFHVSEFITIKTELVIGDEYGRFAGLYSDPNYYSINLIIALTLLVVLYLKDEIKFFQCIILSSVLIYFAALTVSKSALLMLCFPILMLLYVFIKKGNFFGIVFVIAIISGAILLLTNNQTGIFTRVISRFSNANTDITSGRTELWKMFVAYLKDNPVQLFFGRSVGHYTLNGHVAHNTYIDIIYELGIFGGILFIALLVCIVRSSNDNSYKKNLINYSIIAIILIMYTFLSELQYFDPPFHIILASMVLNLNMRTDTAKNRNKLIV